MSTFDPHVLPPQWTVVSAPASGQASASKAASAGVAHVCTGISAAIAATGTAPTALNLVVNLIDGVSGGTTYLWREVIAIPATAGATASINITGLNIVAPAGDAMTLEFSATGGTNTVESVTLQGYDQV